MAEITHSVTVVCDDQAEVDALLERLTEMEGARDIETDGLTITFGLDFSVSIEG